MRPEWIVGLACLALGAVILLLLHLRINRISESVTRMEGTFEQAAEEMTQAAEELRRSNQRSEQAESRARTAEEQQSEAEAARQQAEQDALTATQESELARQQAAASELEALQARQEAAALRRAQEEELNRLQESLNQISETRRTALGVVMNLSGDALRFEFDRAVLSPQSRELLSRIAGILLTLPKSYGVYVYGHTDDVGTAEYNMQLSKRRAQSVRDYLVEVGIEASQITTEGFGKDRPLVPGSTPAARAQNRRVEIGIVNTEIRYREILADRLPR